MLDQAFQWEAKLLQALAHPKRLEIINLLREKELSVGDIYTMLDLPQANVSQHLMVLKEAGIVSQRREGKYIFYQVTYPEIWQASDLLRTILRQQHQDNNASLSWKLTDLLPFVHDPVCQMKLSAKTAEFSSVFQGNTYYFCASGCQKRFLLSPYSYLPTTSIKRIATRG